MKTLDAGHKYALNVLDVSIETYSTLTFVKREGEKYPGNVGNYPGTTIQEVLRACIARLRYVNEQQAAPETEAALELLKVAIQLLENRAARLHQRELMASDDAIFGSMCNLCGHVGCLGNCR